MIRVTLAVLAILVVVAVATPEQAVSDDFGCAGAAVATVSCGGVAAAPAEAAILVRRVTLFDRLRARRAARIERRELRRAGCSGTVAVPVAAYGCGG